MKPKRIFLVRHGESEGNVDKSIYANKPDYALELTVLGHHQAVETGKDIAAYLENEGESITQKIQFYISPFWRARQTYAGIAKSFQNHVKFEDPRLREQEWGHLRDQNITEKIEEYRDNYGHFYYRFNDGESCADVYDRISTFLETLHRDFEKKDYAQNVIIVNHGMTLRVFLMRWFHISVEEFETLANPKNGEYHILELQDNGKYKLITALKKQAVEHNYQFKHEQTD